MSYRWKCTGGCGTASTVEKDEFPITCCGVQHNFPRGVRKQLPGKATQAANLARDTVRHVANGLQLVDDFTRNWRHGQCQACDEYFDHERETCSHLNCGCGMKRQRGIVDALSWASKRCPIGRWDHLPPRFITTADLARDTLALAHQLPPNLAGIVGVPRSGMIPAALLATHLHLPLYSLRLPIHCGQTGVIEVGNGWRLADAKRTNGPLLVIDDTSMHGDAMRQAREQWHQHGGGRQALFAAVYCSPRSAHKRGPMPDLWAVDLQHPHYLEWCLLNSGFVRRMAVDFDGILTRDGTVFPHYRPKKYPLELIVTGRLEKDRQCSEAWLKHHGIAAKQIVMYPGTLAERDQPGELARYKAEHFLASGLELFIESDREQAEQIAKLTGKHVICPAAGRVFT
jgi:orotate phosphoribosyltransferase